MPKKTLTLQITGDSFQLILKGKQKVESRNVYPSTAKRYFEDPEAEELKLIQYDELYLINGRQKTSPRLRVNVKSVDAAVMTDDKGKDIVFEENGQEYVLVRIFYHLGKITETENV